MINIRRLMPVLGMYISSNFFVLKQRPQIPKNISRNYVKQLSL